MSFQYIFNNIFTTYKHTYTYTYKMGGKNVFGGNGAKKGARTSVSKHDRNRLRVAEEEGEKYAIVTKMLGNGCNVHCEDGIARLCIIRGKFQGKGKSTNIISSGTWLLVGLRDWESAKEGSKPKCDLLEVYTHVDKERLKSYSTTVNWSVLADNDVTNMEKLNGQPKTETQVHFMTEKEQDYLKTMEEAQKAPTEKVDFTNESIVDQVYVDDI